MTIVLIYKERTHKNQEKDNRKNKWEKEMNR